MKGQPISALAKLLDSQTASYQTLQNTAKGTARDLQHTMNQKKALTQDFTWRDTALVRSFEETITQLLVLALPRTGRLGLEVDSTELLIKADRERDVDKSILHLERCTFRQSSQRFII